MTCNVKDPHLFVAATEHSDGQTQYINKRYRWRRSLLDRAGNLIPNTELCRFFVFFSTLRSVVSFVRPSQVYDAKRPTLFTSDGKFRRTRSLSFRRGTSWRFCVLCTMCIKVKKLQNRRKRLLSAKQNCTASRGSAPGPRWKLGPNPIFCSSSTVAGRVETSFRDS